jgi:hypothetical protein
MPLIWSLVWLIEATNSLGYKLSLFILIILMDASASIYMLFL